jgi:hypothetical protein
VKKRLEIDPGVTLPDRAEHCIVLNFGGHVLAQISVGPRIMLIDPDAGRHGFDVEYRYSFTGAVVRHSVVRVTS